MLCAIDRTPLFSNLTVQPNRWHPFTRQKRNGTAIGRAVRKISTVLKLAGVTR